MKSWKEEVIYYATYKYIYPTLWNYCYSYFVVVLSNAKKNEHKKRKTLLKMYYRNNYCFSI